MRGRLREVDLLILEDLEGLARAPSAREELAHTLDALESAGASVAVASLEAGLLQQIDFRLPERTFHVLTHRERYVSHAAQAFLKMLNAAPGTKPRNEKKR